MVDVGADLVICLKFPAYCVSHPRKVVWLLHQHRAAYELWDEAAADDHARWLRGRIHEADRRALGSLGPRLLTNSANVSRRLRNSLGIDAAPLYHPPPILPSANRAEPDPADPFIFCPSRQETLKRQDLLIAAMALTKTKVRAVLSGTGGQAGERAAQVAALGLRDRINLIGEVPDAVVSEHYAQALAVFYGPLDEDYGYVTLETMLHRRPLITTTDAGGPLEFVTDGREGRVVAAEPPAIAAAIDALVASPAEADRLGKRGLAGMTRRGITWPNVVETLLAAGAA